MQIIFEFDDLALIRENGLAAVYCSGTADIHIDRNGTWTIEGVNLTGTNEKYYNHHDYEHGFIRLTSLGHVAIRALIDFALRRELSERIEAAIAASRPPQDPNEEHRLTAHDLLGGGLGRRLSS